MVTNFDSTEQKRIWNKLLDKRQQQEDKLAAEQQRPSITIPRISNLWVRNRDICTCERLLNADNSFVTYFAGVIRTAYLYCPQIMLTDAEICDGLFFLALGPTTVNSLLGKSYKDSPSIIISGRAESFEECLFRFTLTTVGEVRQDAKNKKVDLTEAAKRNPVADDQYTIRPLEYCTLDRSISHNMALSQSPHFYKHLTEQVNAWKNNMQRLPDLIVEAFGIALHNEHHFDYLAQRWQEWLTAVSQGLVTYENQNAPDVRKRVYSNRNNPEIKNKDFKEIFCIYSAKNAELLKNSINSNGTHSSTKDFLDTLENIQEKEKRSDAFACIDQCNLLEEPAPQQEQREGTITPTKALLKDWYQFVYQRSLATHLGACLTAVSTSENSYEQIAGQHMASFIKDEPIKEEERDQSTSNEPRKSPLKKILEILQRRFNPASSQSLMLSGTITDVLGSMPYHVFACFCYEARTTISEWRSCSPTTSAREKRLCTKNIAYLVQQASEEVSLLDDGKSMFFKNIFAGILTLLSVLCDQIWFNNNGVPLWLMVVVAWGISMAPDIWDMLTWIKGTHSTFKTIVFMEE